MVLLCCLGGRVQQRQLSTSLKHYHAGPYPKHTIPESCYLMIYLGLRVSRLFVGGSSQGKAGAWTANLEIAFRP